ncbi:MAG TPA: NAD(P)H-dependent glycerol-3-phosphate dehydrogenase [Candidatus Dormibacteraeota bacterium]
MTRPVNVAVIGAGSWGTTVASIVARRNSTIIWARRDDVAREIQEDHTNSGYTGERPLYKGLRSTSSLEEAAGQADVLVMAVPSHGFRAVLEEASPYVRPWIPIVSLTKGLEQDSNKRMTEIISEVLPGHPAGVLAGPNLAREILDGFAAAALLAMPDAHVARSLQDIFRSTLFRVYAGTDVVGAEISGPLKNVFAIAAGMASGLSTGDNTLALVISRSLAELTRLGMELGGEMHTFAGLAGAGDLIATCISNLSRNRTVGVELAKGRSIEEITTEMKMVAEGVKTSRVVEELAREHGLDLPIAHEVYCVCHESKTPIEAFAGLLQRRPTHELEAG